MAKEYTRALTIYGNVPVAGNIILFDDFEHLLNWSKFEGAGDAIFELDPTVAKQGLQSLLMKTRTVAAAAGDRIGASRYVHNLPAQFVGFITSFFSPDFTKSEYIEFRFFFNDGALRKIAAIRFYPNVPVWKYEYPYETFIDIPSSAFTLGNSAWHQISLQASFTLNTYLSLQIDHKLFDLSTFPTTSDTNVTAISLTESIYMETAGASPAELSIDQVIIHEL